jgi:hypothetical protein
MYKYFRNSVPCFVEKIADLSEIKLAIIYGTAMSRVGHASVYGEY